MSPSSTSDRPLVLVVDDYQDAREMYVEYLELFGFRVAEAKDGQEAVDKALSLLPDVILMDLSLPVLDGWEATRRIRAADGTKDTPVVALTGHTLDLSSAEVRDSGCNAFVLKPCLPEALVAELRRVLARDVRSAP